MTSKITIALLLLMVMTVFSSCLSTDDDTVRYDDAVITAFSLKSIKYERTLKSSKGEDSTVTYTYSASATPIHIDQVNNKIYNTDSLLLGTRMDKVLANITAKNGGVVLIKNLDNDGYTYYNSGDTIDFSKERQLKVMANNGVNSRTYTVKLVAHEQDGEAFTWTKLGNCTHAEDWVEMKGVEYDGVLYILGKFEAGGYYLYTTAYSPSTTMVFIHREFEHANEASMATAGNRLYVLADGVLNYLEKSNEWHVAFESATSDITETNAIKTLIGGAGNELYALNTMGNIVVSTDGGATWAMDDMEGNTYYDNSDKLPAKDISLVVSTSKTNSDVKYATIIANKKYTGSDDKFANAVVWNKVVDASSKQTWTYTNISWNNHNKTLPRLNNLVAVPYASNIIALGGEPVNGTTKPFSCLYVSSDCGATWQQSTSFTLPKGFEANKAAAIIADSKGEIYIFAGGTGQVWRGHQNKQTWEKDDKYFY